MLRVRRVQLNCPASEGVLKKQVLESSLACGWQVNPLACFRAEGKAQYGGWGAKGLARNNSFFSFLSLP
jgi:hypothetical protein